MKTIAKPGSGLQRTIWYWLCHPTHAAWLALQTAAADLHTKTP